MNPGGGLKTEAVNNVMRGTSLTHSILSNMLHQVDPISHAKYRQTFLVLRQKRPEPTNAVWLGRAIVYKVQTRIHKDNKDGKEAWCGCVNGGSYERLPDPDIDPKYGCAMVFPQLGLAFE